jgi:putative transposase
MGRAKRADEAGAIYHMLNRANRRATIFHQDADYDAFEQIMAEALDRVQLKLFSYCLMPNHWHLVVSPELDGEMSRFGQWLGLTHTQRYNAYYHTTGEGHLYQGRYKSFPVQGDEHFLSVCRYVERNAYSAGLCDSPDLWRYGSLWRWRYGTAGHKLLLSPWPIPRRPGWVDRVREPLTAHEQNRLQRCMKRGAPYGDETWVEAVARRCSLESTLRPRGRPAKFPR